MLSSLQDRADLLLITTSAGSTTFALFGPSGDDAVNRTWLDLALTHFIRRTFGRRATKLRLNSKGSDSSLPSWATAFIAHTPRIPLGPFSIHRAISEFTTLLFFKGPFALEASELRINKDISGARLSTITTSSVAWRPT
jgi:hypothetical protein